MSGHDMRRGTSNAPAGGMLSAVLEHYAKYQQKKQKRVGGGGGRGGGGGEDESFSTNGGELDSIYRNSINGSGIEFLVKDPICRGYLLAFCEECYNAENMLFLIEVEKFREVLKPDKSLWPGTYQEIDSLVAIDPTKEWKWRSRISLESVMEHVRYIYEHFINEGAETQICVSTAVLQRTKKRVDLIAAYGRETFHEMSLDPFRTLERDILPRFVVSEKYRKLCEKLDMITHLPAGDTLVVEPPPPSADFEIGTSYGDEKMFTLEELLKSNFLYNKFLSHLRAQMSSENLLCRRLIELFQEKMRAGDKDAATTIAWDIYRYFVAAHSAYEVSLEYVHKTELKFHLARPTATMFDALYRSVNEQLNANFSSFKSSPTYRNLGREFKAEVESRRRAESKGSKPRGCLG